MGPGRPHGNSVRPPYIVGNNTGGRKDPENLNRPIDGVQSTEVRIPWNTLKGTTVPDATNTGENTNHMWADSEVF